MMLKEAKTVLLLLAFIVIFLGVMTIAFQLKSALVLLVLALAAVGGILFFFRSPSRQIPAGSQLVLAPADGKVIAVTDHFEDTYLQAPSKKVSIFLSIFNVHVNRSPIDGEVEYQEYKPGSFEMAFHKGASTDNEHNAIGIKHGSCKIFIKQISGFLARRIVSYLQVGQQVKKGDIFGMIKFGSRVDLFLPEKVKLSVKMGDIVKAGESIIGEIQ
jgi:phosphatidylserine decarboxylase